MKIIQDFRPAGHGYFRDARGRLAIADCSGYQPQDTDDGVLYVDVLRGITIGSRGLALALLGSKGTGTPISVQEAKWLVYNAGVEIYLDGLALTARPGG